MIKITDNKKNNENWGGQRQGSGRKPLPIKRKRRDFRLTDEEHAKVKKYVEKVKEETKKSMLKME